MQFAVFGQINNCVEELVGGLQKMADNMKAIGEEKDEVQDSIRSLYCGYQCQGEKEEEQRIYYADPFR